MFNENSGLVKVWVRLLLKKGGTYVLDDVPAISNLREVVEEILSKNNK